MPRAPLNTSTRWSQASTTSPEKGNDEVQTALEELVTEGRLAKTENVNKIPMFYPTAQKS